MTPDAGPPADLLAAFEAYERALMADDLDALDAAFAPGPGTLRGDAAGLLVGHDLISDFRGSRGGVPALSAPFLTVPSPLGPAPVGVCFLGPVERDLDLVRTVRSLEAATAT